MSKFKLDSTEKTLRVWDIVFIGLGMTMAIVTALIALVSNAASPGLQLLSFIVGLLLVLHGIKPVMKKEASRIDHELEPYLTYRVTRWLTKGVYMAFAFIISTLLFFLFDDEESPRDHEQSDHLEDADTDRIWQASDKHYWDNKPPPPFS